MHLISRPFFFISILIFSYLISGCHNSAKKWGSEKNSPMGNEGNTLFKFKAVGLPQANQYQINLRWAPVLLKDSEGEDRTWILLKKQNDEEVIPFQTLIEGQTESSDTKVQAGMTYIYSLGFLIGSHFVEKATLKATVPVDLVVSTIIQANNISTYRRIFLTKSGVIETQGVRTQITADELISDDGIIRTFSESYRVELGSNGQEADILVIQVNKAAGKLTIEAKGQVGGGGVTGMTGAKGVTGRPGAQWELVKPTKDSIVANILTDQHFPPLAPEWHLAYLCVNPNGHNGDLGLPGYPGLQGGLGGKGGNTPKVYLQVTEGSELDLSIETKPGRGGNAGEGGEGGEGGDGGPGSWDPHHICPEPSAGPKGVQGSKGPIGNAGPDGKISPICKKIQGQEEGDCAAFFEKNGFVF